MNVKKQSSRSLKKNDFMDDIKLETINIPAPEDKNEKGFKMFMIGLFIGPMGRGKSYACIKLAKYLEKNNLINEIILVSPTQQGNPFHNLDIPEENKIRDTENIEKDLLSVIKYCDERVKTWQEIRKQYTEKQYNKIYKKVHKLYSEIEKSKKKE